MKISLKTYRTILWTSFIVYGLVMAKLLFFKTTFGSPEYYQLHRTHQFSLKASLQIANFVPGRGIKNVIGEGRTKPGFAIANLGGNVLLFMPIGLLVPLLFRGRWTVKRVLLLGLLTSVTIELTQLFSLIGCCDVDDVLLNVLGVVAGFLLLKRLSSSNTTSNYFKYSFHT